MKNFTVLLLLFSFTAKAQLQQVSGGTTTTLVAAGGGTYAQGITLTANTTLKTLDNKAYTISGVITGAFDLTAVLAANSKLTLSGANTYSGSTSVTGVSGGELILTNTPGFRSSALSVSAGAVLTIDASAYGSTNSTSPYLVFGSSATSNITVTGAGQVNFKGVTGKYYGVYISSSKSMVFSMSSGGQLNIATGNWIIGASGVNAFTGNLGSLNVAAGTRFIISGTTAQFDKVTGTGRIHSSDNDIAIKIGANNGTCDWDGVFFDNNVFLMNIEKVGTGTIAFTNTNLQHGTITITAGTLSIGNGGDSGYIGDGDIVNNATLILNQSEKSNLYQSIELRNAISGRGNFIKKGDISASLFGDTNGILDYTGTTTVESGKLTLTLNCKEMKNSGIIVQSGATLATYPNTTNNGEITSSGGLSMTASSILNFAFTTDANPYAKLVVPNITAPDGFMIKFTGGAPVALSGEKVLIGCTGTLPTKLPTIVESSVDSGLYSKKCIALKWVPGTGLVGTIKAGTIPTISPTYLNTCVGDTQRFTVTSGGTPATPAWTSSNPEVVSISADGVAKPLFQGTSTITYLNTEGCAVSTPITARGHVLRPEPNTAFCAGNTITLKAYNKPEGGSYSNRTPAWTSNNDLVATVNTGDKGPGEPVGYVTLLKSGIATITFTYYNNSNYNSNYSDGCPAEYKITVKDLPTITPSTPVSDSAFRYGNKFGDIGKRRAKEYQAASYGGLRF